VTARLIDGKAAAKTVQAEVAAGVQALAARGVVATLAVVRAGDDEASAVYARNKQRAATRVGIRSLIRGLPATATTAEVLATIQALNDDPAVHGVLVQLPLPAAVDAERVIAAVAPTKDVDGFHPENVGRLVLGQPRFVPCTPAGVMYLLRRDETPLVGQRAVVVGRSAIVGKPMAALLIAADATVTVCHSRTADLPGEVARADIVVAAIGRPEFIRGAWIKPGATVIDVGINRRADGALVGDVEFAAAADRAAAITPVPGGVGPTTVAFLLQNTLRAASLQTA